MYNVILGRFRARQFGSGKTIGITYSEFVSVALVIQHAMRMSHIVIYGLFGFVKLFHIPYIRHDFRNISE